MIIVAIIAVWIVLAIGMGIYAMRTATEAPLVECFDCNKTSCTGCPFLEKARQESAPVELFEEQQRIAA